MKFHIHLNGFNPRYIKWKYHGESTILLVVDDIAPMNEMVDIIVDVIGGLTHKFVYVGHR